MNGIIELRQIEENEWKAKYQGNYGLYTIKITTDGKSTTKFSCSCPSDYFPCKHIPMVEKAIAEKLALNKKKGKHGTLQIEDLIGNVSAEKLREFIIAQAKYNAELQNAVFLEFASNAGNTKGNKYSTIIQKALTNVPYYEDDYYCEESQDIDALDQWLDKTRKCVRLKQYGEAISICKAIIEEYSQWLYNAGEDVSLLFHHGYQTDPFEILEEAAKHINNEDRKELFNYCLSEMKKKKYAGSDLYYNENFHRLLGKLAAKIDPDAFIALQDELLAGIKDKSSYETQTILQRKIDFYRSLRQKNKAWELIKSNIQIESFRRELTEKKIKERDFAAAKKLIYDFFDKNNSEEKSGRIWNFHNYWNEMLLDIAQKEKDIPVIRKLAYGFIERDFEKKYYEIYKATFNPAEWDAEMEKLLLHYDEKHTFRYSVAELLKAEKDTQRLLNYIEKHLSVDTLEQYNNVFADAYPEKTLQLFKKAIVSYAADNTGRSCYEHILTLLRRMSRIKGGKQVALDMAEEFKACYKNRRAMIEILGRFK